MKELLHSSIGEQKYNEKNARAPAAPGLTVGTVNTNEEAFTLLHR